MTEQRNWKRIRERLELKLPVRVQCRETPESQWIEITRLNDVTPFGCSFTLKRPIEKGRLLHMTIPMPRQLRTFDHKGEVELSEHTVTENISPKGAAIYTTLSLPVGRFIRLSSEQFKLTVFAAVRGQSIGPTGVPRVHVEFVDREWPL